MILIDFNSEATKKEIVQTLRRCACWLRNSACEFGLGRIFESICNRSRRLSYPILFSLIICIRHSTLLSFCCAILWPVMMLGTTTSLASEVQRMNKHNFLCLGVSFYSKSIFENDWHRRAMSNFRTLFFNLGFWDRLSPAKVVGDSSPSKSKYQML